MRKMNFLEVDRLSRFYNPNNILDIEGVNLKFMSGYFTASSNLKRGINITVDFSCRLLRKDTLLDEIYRLRD